MRVTRVVTLGSETGAYGGPWSTACRQAGLLSDAGEDVTLLFGHIQGDRPLATPSGVRVTTAPVRRWVPVGRFSGLFSLRLMLKTLAEVRKSDVVHVSAARDLIPVFATLCALVMQRRLVIQPHGMLAPSSGRLARALQPLWVSALRRAHAVISLTGVESSELRNQFGAKIQLVELGNSIPDSLLSYPPDISNEVEVLFLARVHPRKCPQDFVTAASMAKEPAYWRVVGPDDGALEATRTLNDELGGPVLFEPPVPPADVYDRVSRAHVFVLPARNEPWGNVLVAAMALGLPVVVTQSTALADLIHESGAGYVVPDGDPHAIASAVDALVGDEGLYRTVSERARSLAAAQFSDSALRSRFLGIFAGEEADNHASS